MDKQIEGVHKRALIVPKRLRIYHLYHIFGERSLCCFQLVVNLYFLLVNKPQLRELTKDYFDAKSKKN